MDGTHARNARRRTSTSIYDPVNQNSASWNQVAGWLRHLGDLRAHALAIC